MLRHAWLIAVIIAAPLAAQKSGPQGDTWESIAKLPDFGGLWEGGGGAPRGAGAEPPSLTPPYAAKLQDIKPPVEPARSKTVPRRTAYRTACPRS